MSKSFLNNRDSLSWEQARHLLNRAGFGGRKDEIQRLTVLKKEQAVDSLFDFQPSALPEPEWLPEYDWYSRERFRALSPDDKRAVLRKAWRHTRSFQVYWLRHMIAAETPAAMLREKMTFFWHCHFATSAEKVKLTPLLYQQLVFLRQHALGSFRDLLHGIAKDPAMLHYLDNNQNYRGKPNENFARELMELFSLGEGHYTEADIKESARAFTGWTNDPFRFHVRWRKHDFGRKTFLDRSGFFDGDDIIDIILEQPACAEFITRKILAFLGFETASDEIVSRLASTFRDSDYHIPKLLKEIFLLPEFYADAVLGNQIKSPVQLVVGTARTLDLQIERPNFYLYALQLMGQIPYQPPNVKGWPGGKAWINTSRLLARFAFAEIISRDMIDPKTQSNYDNWRDFDLNRKFGDDGHGSFWKQVKHIHIDFEPFAMLGPQNAQEPTVSDLTAVLLPQKPSEAENAPMVSNLQAYLQKMPEKAAYKKIIGDVMKLPVYQLC